VATPGGETALDTHAALVEHVQSALGRVRAVLARSGVDGVVLTTPGSVAWVTGGINVPIDRSAGQDVVWLAVGPERACVLTTNVEEPRLRAEHAPADLGLDLRVVPWWDSSALVAASAEVLGTTPGALGSDGHPGFGVDLAHDVTCARLSLDPWEQDRLRNLGRDATTAVESALRAWHPGEEDRAVAARIAAAVELAGAQAPILLVGGDDRLRRFRHPVAVGRPIRDIVMAVLVAARDGQHVALTRYTATEPAAQSLARSLDSVRRVHRRALAASTVGATAGDVLTELAQAYADEGAPEGWADHYQGGPIGYAQREFEIAPTQTESPWWATVLPWGSAVAWNPSLSGGAKDEDTYLIGDRAVEAVTVTPDWPVADRLVPARPAVLVAGAADGAGH
jgi:Xaa-Pro dipeptidase